ncbi:MAG: cytochrome C oxidase subunit IV family protein [Gemmatimonadota bacterium]
MERTTAYRTYWIAWGLLLILTLSMILVELAGFPFLAAVGFLVAAMMAKATVIAGWFMHLRFERRALVLAVVAGTLLTAAFLFGLIAVDGAAMQRLAG